MKWKAVTRRTRILGVFALLSAAAVVWASVLVHRDPCANLTGLDVSPDAIRIGSTATIRKVAEASRPPHLVRVQDDDNDDTTNSGVGGIEYPPMVRAEEPQSAPCAALHERNSAYRGAALTSFAVFTLSTLYSYYRDRRRYRKRLLGRARRAEHRRRRDAGVYQSTAETPFPVREALANLCACGCGEATFDGEEFVPGHARMLRLELEEKAGGLIALRDLVELHARPEDHSNE
jgi:hypothetical protein